MKTTRRQFIKSLLATAAGVAIAPQVLIEPVRGSSELTPQERDAVADVMGLRKRQWRGANLWRQRIESDTEWLLERLAEDITRQNIHAGTGIGMLPNKPTSLFGIPIDQGVFREESDGMFFDRKSDPGGGYLIPEEYRQRIIKALNKEWDRQFLEGVKGGSMPQGILGLDDNPYDPEPDALQLHVHFDQAAVVWRTRELKPDPDQKSPFYRTVDQ